MADTSFLDEPVRSEVDSFSASLEPVSVPTLSHEGLVGLRDVIGTSEVMRALGKLGLGEADAFSYARQTARSVCSVLEQIRLYGDMDVVRVILYALVIGYERGVHDAAGQQLSSQGLQILSDKVEREEAGGRSVAQFRKELKDL